MEGFGISLRTEVCVCGKVLAGPLLLFPRLKPPVDLYCRFCKKSLASFAKS